MPIRGWLRHRKLTNATECPVRTFDGKSRWAKVLDVYDGDTITIVTNLSNDEPYYQYKLRLHGLDTPELRPSKDVPHREQHIQAALYVRKQLQDQIEDRVVRIDFTKEEKFGRLMGTIWIMQRKWYGVKVRHRNINAWLLERGYAVSYNGERKETFTVEQLDRILREQSMVSDRALLEK